MALLPWLQRNRSWRKGYEEALRIKQATDFGLPTHTPTPIELDYGSNDARSLSSHFFHFQGPQPDQIEYLFLRSDEWARVIVRLRNEVWRNGIEVVPTHDQYCKDCHAGCDNADECPACGGTEFTEPDPQERALLEAFLKEANTEHESLTEIGARKTEEGLKHGRSYVVLKKAYTLDETGRIETSTLKAVRVASPGRVRKLRKPNGQTGGRWVCLKCRARPRYEGEHEPGKCQHCKTNVLYEAWYVEYSWTANVQASGKPIAWYLPSEMHETRWPYKDGSPPVARIWPKASALLLMDWYAAWALDPRRDKRPDKVFVTMGGDAAAIEKWAKRDAEERKKNPYKMSHLHLPHPPGGLENLKMAADVLDMGESEFKGQMIELRKEFEDAVRKHYHLAPIQGGDTEGSGGLNNESQQLRSTGQVAQDFQRAEAVWLTEIPPSLGVSQWTYAFYSPDEEKAEIDEESVQRNLEMASKAKELGLEVEWQDGRAVIKDGQVKTPLQAPLAGFGYNSPTGSPGLVNQAQESVEELQPSLLQQAGPAFSREDLTKDLKELFGGPSGAVAAQDALHPTFAGLDPETTQRIQAEIVDAMSQPQGWSTTTIRERIEPIIAAQFQRQGIDPSQAGGRAETIARTESRAITSVWRQRLFESEEARRGEQFKYRVRGPDDFRTTKQSRWVRQQVGDGVPLDQLTKILDQAVQLAKEGAFTENGELSSVPGEPIQLPSYFNRRGFLVAFNDRDRVTQVRR